MTDRQVDFTEAAWRKSTYSNDSGSCVEVAHVDRVVGVRDTKDRDSGRLVFGAAEWDAFLQGVRGGEL